MSWAVLAAELAAWRDAGREARLWWRDDDAAGPGADLDRVLILAGQTGVPLNLAVIPDAASAALAARIGAADGSISLLQHGFRHSNHAPETEKRSEFGPHRPVHERLGDLVIGWQRLRLLFEDGLCPVFVPPWNRIGEDFVPRLVNGGMAGLSRFGPRAGPAPVPGLREINCHVDPIDWHGSRTFIGAEAACQGLAQALGRVRALAPESGEPIGLLTHHAVDGQAVAEFLTELFERTKQEGGCRWLTARELFELGP